MKSIPVKSLPIDSLPTSMVESSYLNKDMCKFESSQKDENRGQSDDCSKTHRKHIFFKLCFTEFIVSRK